MTSSLLAAGPPADEKTKSHEEGSVAPLFQPAPGLYHRANRSNLWTAS
jgi:hypothetical protein